MYNSHKCHIPIIKWLITTVDLEKVTTKYYRISTVTYKKSFIILSFGVGV